MDVGFLLLIHFGHAGVFGAVCRHSPSSGEWGLFSNCNAWASHCRGFFCCRALSLEHGLNIVVPWV